MSEDDRPGDEAGTLLDVLRDDAARDPDAVAFTHLTFPAGSDPGGRGASETITRGVLRQRADAVAAALTAHAEPSDRVLVLLGPGLDMLVGLTGVLYAGMVATLCAPPTEDAGDLRAERVVRIAEQAQISAVVTTAAYRDRLGGLRSRLGDVAWLAVDDAAAGASAEAYVPPTVGGSDLALLQFAPGPTGAGRGIMVSHANLLAQIRQTVALAGLPHGTNVVSWISPYHALGIAGHLLLSQYLGGQGVFLAPEDFVADPLRWLRAISDTPGPVFSCAPNFAFDRCVGHIGPDRRRGLDLSGWHTAFNAAERVRPGTMERFLEAFGPHGFAADTMAPGYGMSETMLFLTGRRSSPAALVVAPDPEQLQQGRVVCGEPTGSDTVFVGLGPAGPHCDVRVVDPDERTVLGADRVGEVWVRGSVVCQGYWGRPELTDEVFGGTLADGDGPFLRTGDLGFWHDGELVLCGRRKELVIIRGRNLFPDDVEATCARTHPAFGDRPAAAFSVDTDGEERLVVVQPVAKLPGAEPQEAEPQEAEPQELARQLRAAVTGDHEVEVHEVVLVAADALGTERDAASRRSSCRARYLAGELSPVAVSRAAAPPVAGSFGPLRGMLLALEEPLRGPVLIAELRSRLAAFLGTTAADIAVGTPLAGLGLESLRAIELRRDMERDLGVAIPIVEFMRGSVSSLAELMTGQLGDAPRRRDIAWRPVLDDPDRRNEPFPLTEQQYAYFVGRSTGYELGEVSIHIYVEVDAPDVDLDRLGGALNRLVAHQEMLRAVVRADGTQQIRPVEEVTSVPITVSDLTAADGPQRTAHLEQVREELSHQVLPLGSWPMFEVRATRLPEGTRVHVSLDLLVADVASVRLFFLEWGDFYRDPQAHQQPPAVSFRDYVLALDQVPESPAYEQSRDYWLARIPDLPPGPELPVVSGADRRGRTRRSHVLAADRWSRLRARAAERGLTPSVVQLAAFAEVLGRWSSNSRFTVNVPLFNRMPLHPDIDTIIGDFTAVTLLEVDVAPDDGIGGLADRIQRQLWQDLEHRYFSGVEVMRELSRQRGVRPGTFATVIFASAREQGRDQEGNEGALGSSWLGDTAYVVSQTPQVLFDHQVYEDRGALSFNWDVVEGMFTEDVLDDMFSLYCTILDRLVDDDTAWSAGAFELLSERHRALLRDAHGPEVPVPDGLLFSAIAEQAAARPEHDAVVGVDGVLSYGELYRRATALGRQLRAAGVLPNQLVAVAVDKSATQYVAALGVQLAGGAYLPVDPDLPTARQDHMLSHGEVRIVLTRAGGPDRSDWPTGVRPMVVDLKSTVEDEGPLEPVQQPTDLAYVLYTSGSTGTPKGVMLSHRATLNTIDQVRQRCGIGPSDVALGLSALSFDLSVWDLFGMLGAGATVVLPEPGATRDPGRWLELMAEHGVTTWNSVPALAQMLVEQAEPDGGHPGLAGLRLMWLSGDWIPLALPDRVRALAPDTKFVASGGPTETAIWCVAYDVDTVDESWESIPYGRPLANHRIHLLNDRMRPCPVGVAGEMYIGGAGLADGYWRDPQRTDAVFVAHPETGERLYRSGDLGRWRSDGTLQILGRDDAQVKIGGFRVELGEVEAALTRQDRVREAAVVAAGPDRHRRRLVAFVVPSAGSGLTAGAPPAAGTELDPATADKLLLGDVLTDPVGRAEFTLARHGLRRDLTATPVALPTRRAEDAEQVWARRSSRRSYATAPVPLAALGQLLEGLSSRDGGALPKYRYASAGALYPVQVYVYVREGRVDGLPGGSYYHDPSTHRLVPVRPGAVLERDVHVSTNHDAFDGSAFELFLVGRMSAIEPLYGSRATHFSLLEAGQISQLLDDTAPELDLGLCQLGLIRDAATVRELLDLSPEDTLLHTILGGGLAPAVDQPGPTGTVLADRIRAELAETLPHYLVPHSVVILDALPLSGRGKVDRAELERLALDAGDDSRHGSAAPYAAPGSATEQTIAEVIQRVLGIERVGVDDRFFDLGADSVALVRVYRELGTALGREFPLMHMFEHPTIRRLAVGLDGGEANTDAVDAAYASGSRRRARRRRGSAGTGVEEQT